MKGGCAHGQRMGMLIRERRRPLQEAMGREAKDPKPPHAGVCGVWGELLGRGAPGERGHGGGIRRLCYCWSDWVKQICSPLLPPQTSNAGIKKAWSHRPQRRGRDREQTGKSARWNLGTDDPSLTPQRRESANPALALALRHPGTDRRKADPGSPGNWSVRCSVYRSLSHKTPPCLDAPAICNFMTWTDGRHLLGWPGQLSWRPSWRRARPAAGAAAGVCLPSWAVGEGPFPSLSGASCGLGFSWP